MKLSFETRALAARAARLTGTHPDTIEETEHGFCLAVHVPHASEDVRKNVLRSLRAFGCKPKLLPDLPAPESAASE